MDELKIKHILIEISRTEFEDDEILPQPLSKTPELINANTESACFILFSIWWDFLPNK